MVAVFQPELKNLLYAISKQQRVRGLEAFAQSQPQGIRTIYRWHRVLGTRLVYFPHLSYEALGLQHLHVFLQDPLPELTRYAIDSAWVTTTPGTRLRYLHCLIPTSHRDRVQSQLANTTHVWSGDGWQTMSDLQASIDDAGRPREHETEDAPALPHFTSPLLTEHPLAVPIIFETIGRRQSMNAVWRSIYDRLGDRVWAYLPRRTRRWPHNGKTYITTVYRAISDAGLVRQHIVRYAPLHEHTVEVFLHTDDPDAGLLLHDLGRVAPVLERYPTSHGYFVRVLGDHRLLKRLARTRVHCDWWFASDEPAPEVRFAYEQLFDPTLRSWVQA